MRVGGDLTKEAAKRVLWAMVYADDAGIASRCQASLEKMMTAIVEVYAAFGLIVSEKKTLTMHMRPPTMKAEAVAVEAAGQRYGQVDTFVYLGSTISSVGDVGPEIKRRTGYAWNCFPKYSRAVYEPIHRSGRQGPFPEGGSTRGHALRLCDVDSLARRLRQAAGSPPRNAAEVPQCLHLDAGRS